MTAQLQQHKNKTGMQHSHSHALDKYISEHMAELRNDAVRQLPARMMGKGAASMRQVKKIVAVRFGLLLDAERLVYYEKVAAPRVRRRDARGRWTTDQVRVMKLLLLLCFLVFLLYWREQMTQTLCSSTSRWSTTRLLPSLVSF